MIETDIANSVMVIEDEDDVRLSTTQTLQLAGFDVLAFGNAGEAVAHINPDWPGIVLTDLKMPHRGGLEVLGDAMAIDAELPVVIVTAYGDIPIAVQAMRDGAYDFIEKTTDPEHLVSVVRRAMEMRRLVLENRALQLKLDQTDELEQRIIGRTPVMERVRDMVRSLAAADVEVLLVGETGTGKEVVARCLHDFGSRRGKPFAALNCGALAEGVIESELFGHEAGAFTGAGKRRIGRIEHADGGTLFLDEIESIPLSVQVKLLRVLQERSLERVGGNTSTPVDIRVVAASKIDLADAVRAGTFREDLLYRLQVAQLVLPPLRERIEDVPLLFRYFVELAARRLHRAVPTLDETVLQGMMARAWPGNVRELRNAAERFVLALPDPDTPAPLTAAGGASGTLNERLSAFERSLIADTLRAHKGRVGESAKALGVPRKTLYLRMQKHGLDRKYFV